jgi:hypothetical protein
MIHTASGRTDDPLYFLHIPKTAGTSFMVLLHAQYEAGTICPAYLWRDLLSIPREQLAAYALFRGHFYAYLESFLERPLGVITFLRDPIARSLSHYAHVKRDPGHYFYQRAQEQGDFVSFLRDPVTNPLIVNFQTRALAVMLDPPKIAAGLSREAVDALMLEQSLETTIPLGISDDELLRRAKAYIDQCLYVGLTERFLESVQALAQYLQWQHIPLNLHLNKTPQQLATFALDFKVHAELYEKTALDHELYAYARARFERQSIKMR